MVNVKDQENTVHIRVVGDNLIHKQLYTAARQESGSYCFDKLYEHIQGLIKECDIGIINQETILVQKEADVSSFPAFGSPGAVADSIARAGFSVVTHASNHALDKKLSGIMDSIAIWRKFPEIHMLGIHDSWEAQESIPVIEKNGVSFALLNYTEKLNYHRLPAKAGYCVDVMKPAFKKRIKQQLQKARAQADVVIVFPHWGCEYLYEPVNSQKKWAHFFADNGADIMIGTHPHVLQNVETITAKNGKKVPCIYSLGNFVSCQIKPGTMLGGMADLTIKKEGSKIEIGDVEIIPLVTHTDREYSYFTAYPLSQYTDELAAENKIFHMVEKNFQTKVNCEYLNKLYRDILDKKAQEYNVYKKPSDITKSNIKAVINALLGINTKG